MPDLTELKEQRNEALSKAQDAVADAKDEDRPLTNDERSLYEDHMSDVTDLNEQISEAREDQKRFDRLDEEQGRLDETPEPKAGRRAFEDAGGDGGDDPSPRQEWRSAFTKYLKNGPQNLSSDEVDTLRNRVPGREARDAEVIVGTSGQGGILVPTELEDTLFQELKQFGGLQEAVDAAPGDPIDFPLDTADGRNLDVPLMDDTANLASQVGEGSTISSVSDISLNDVTFAAQTYQSGPLAVSFEMMQDSAIDPEDVVRQAISNRIGRRWARDLIGSTATSSTAVEGLINASTGATSIANGSSNLGFGDLYDLKHSVDPAHRNRDQRWLFTDNTFKVISKLTDSNGQFLLQPDLQEGTGPGLTLLGAPIHVDNSSTKIEFDAIASSTNKKQVIWYGNFGRFGIRRVRQTEVMTLQEKFALQRKTGFVGFVRVDSRILQSTGLAASQRPIRCLVENT